MTRSTETHCPNAMFDAGSHDYPRLMNPICGAYVCLDCDHHQGLMRCLCGWAAEGGDGRQQLQDMGENLNDE